MRALGKGDKCVRAQRTARCGTGGEVRGRGEMRVAAGGLGGGGDLVDLVCLGPAATGPPPSATDHRTPEATGQARRWGKRGGQSRLGRWQLRAGAPRQYQRGAGVRAVTSASAAGVCSGPNPAGAQDQTRRHSSEPAGCQCRCSRGSTPANPAEPSPPSRSCDGQWSKHCMEMPQTF